MKASELRVGNYVTINNPKSWPKIIGIPQVVTGISFCHDDDFKESDGDVCLNYFGQNKYDEDSNAYNQFSQFIDPIPLTEEWLIRFGFRIFKDEFISPSDFYWVHDKFPGSIGNISWEYHPHKTAPIKYVHQLQNLYFALTGKELTLKP